MVFSSVVFLFLFLPIALGLYYLMPRGLRNGMLFVLSLLFYAWGEPVYIVIMFFSTVLDFTAGYFAGKYRITSPKKAKIAVSISIIGNLSLLGFFKYTNFFLENLEALGISGLPSLYLVLPIGISFYTFQSMSYTIDIYRGEAPVQRNIVDFGAYITLFPQLIAGPIVRYQDVALQLNERRENIPQFASGVGRFLVGLGKKVLLANQFGQLFDLMKEGEWTVLGAWVGLLGYALQIYFDFSGYSDMAIGLGRMFGFSFPENFNYPYIARSITDFWRRWHITLSTWFREYVYIPLGGNRKGPMRTYLNLLVVWALTGFWHGASWNFLAWGLYFALLLMLEKAFLLKWLERAPRWLPHLYAMVAVLIGWGLFSIERLPEAFRCIGALFGFGAAGFLDARALHGLLYWLPLLIAGIIGATPLPRQLLYRLRDARPGFVGRALPIAAMALLALSTAYLVDASYNPFLYFRF